MKATVYIYYVEQEGSTQLKLDKFNGVIRLGLTPQETFLDVITLDADGNEGSHSYRTTLITKIIQTVNEEE